ncbi:MAG TPA: multicopper oxidase domain-containing protein [Candidatus Acidoferrales bacterium]|nr:multicopper oxidase domain-containing protein [Candidatus Acidoferrales bacterium]
MTSKSQLRGVRATVLAIGFCTLAMGCHAQSRDTPERGKTRTYYVAAVELNWDYAPTGRNEAMGMPFDEDEIPYVEPAAHRIGRVYKKAAYREFTDGTFATQKVRTADEAYLGLMGPILRGEVGDTIRVVFRNMTSHPYSMHPHGVLYEKDSEGADYNDGTSGADKEDGGVPPGGTHVYTWKIPERAGPGPNDPSSIFWLYHSHSDEMRDVASGLFGMIVVTRRGMARADGSPKDVDHEFANMFITINENESWYLDENIRDHALDPKGVNRHELQPYTSRGMAGSVVGTGFVDTNLKWSINGYLYGNMPLMTMKVGDRVRWYVATLGDFNNAHTPHWHGNTVVVAGQRTDVISVAAAQMVTADMVPDAAGIWLYHCHFSDHMVAGMMARYEVKPR